MEFVWEADVYAILILLVLLAHNLKHWVSPVKLKRSSLPKIRIVWQEVTEPNLQIASPAIKDAHNAIKMDAHYA